VLDRDGGYRGLMSHSQHLALAPSPNASPRLAEGHPVRVVLAEDHATMRRSLRALLDGEPDIEVVGEADEMPAALAQVEHKHPEVLVLDLRMPNGSNIDCVRRMRARAPGTRVVVITMHEAQAFARQAHDAGAIGFVLKDTADVELPEAVRRAARDEVYTSPRVSASVVPLR
jgi:two-component system, NarL family, response regulator NreC